MVLKNFEVSEDVKNAVSVFVEPGICGFSSIIRAHREGRRSAGLEIESGCEHIQRLARFLDGVVTIKELFLPLSRNPIYVSAERAGCHPSCPLPVAIVKAIEIAMEMALPKDVVIRIERDV